METRYREQFRIVALVATILAGVILGVAAPGDLDPTFGDGGTVVTQGLGNISDIAIQPDGKIIAVGGDKIVRYNQNGSLDSSFGADGIVILQLGKDIRVYANSVVIQADGKIVVAVGSGDFPGGPVLGFAVVRCNPDGTLDTSFNGTGIIFHPSGVGGRSVAIQTDGKIVVVGGGWSFDGTNYESAVFRYHSNGTPDTSFNGTGSIITPNSSAYSVAIQPDGKIVVGGDVPGNATIFRYDPNGLPDTSFGSGGRRNIFPIEGDEGGAYKLAIQSDGKIVAKVSVSDSGGTHPTVNLITRINPNGSDDPFGYVYESYCYVLYAGDLAIQPDGKIVSVGGRSESSCNPLDQVVRRYSLFGSADTTFGDDGFVTTDIFPSAVAIQADGKIVVAGATALARYQGGNTIAVTNTNDGGTGSLRQAIDDATPGDTINFNITGTIILTSGQLTVNKSLTIKGPGADLLAISGNNASSVFHISGDITVTLDGLTIRDGSNGGIAGGGTVTVSNSVITDNGGSGISGIGRLTVVNSTISNNAHHGIFSDAGCYFPKYVSVSNSTISGNGGTAITNYDGLAEIGNSTIVGNRGGILSADDCHGDGGTTRLWNTIVAGNILSLPDIYGLSGTDIFGKAVAVASHNLIGDAAYSGGIVNGVNGNIVGVNTLLGPLQNNGGPTLTHALLPGSPAINAGDHCVLSANGCGFDHPALTTDQRGKPRNGRVDLGAYERALAAFDFDGDGKADPAVFRGAEGRWYALGSAAGSVGGQWGYASDTIAPADYDGDGKTDRAIFRDGVWWVLNSTGGHSVINWGLAGDKVVPADYDGDGRADPAVFRDGVWWIRYSSGGHIAMRWGLPTDTLVPADYDADGKADPAVFRDGVWWIRYSSGGHVALRWGLPTDQIVPADYDGDGKADPAVFRDGVWWIRKSTGGHTVINWGLPNDIPVPADYDGDGKADVAVFRNGTWWIRFTSGGHVAVKWGIAGDVPVLQSRQ